MISLILLDYTADAATSLQEKLNTPEGEVLIHHAANTYRAAKERIVAIDWSQVGGQAVALVKSVEERARQH